MVKEKSKHTQDLQAHLLEPSGALILVQTGEGQVGQGVWQTLRPVGGWSIPCSHPLVLILCWFYLVVLSEVEDSQAGQEAASCMAACESELHLPGTQSHTSTRSLRPLSQSQSKRAMGDGRAEGWGEKQSHKTLVVFPTSGRTAKPPTHQKGRPSQPPAMLFSLGVRR